MTEAKSKKITVLRHADSAYPEDKLKPEGIAKAKKHSDQFSGFESVIVSEYARALQTAIHLSYPEPSIDSSFNELEIDNVNEPTAHEYVVKCHEVESEQVQAVGQLMQLAISQLNENSPEAKNVLIISHNLALSALYSELAGKIDSFEYLSGMEIELQPDGSLDFIKRVSPES